ncbi:U-box domain-containing protein 17-like [Zingiber officinale]|uniref:U-box domain-containing protein 17-like n=1 Tax=Zingiber officinale TaxID=94328 RepID=UPI001C4AB13B|nr:U-box domain-containing protein 17-like [Zingiber officinale]
MEIKQMECDVADGLVDERWAIVMVALASILQYGSYVIFGTLTPQLGSSSGDSKLPLSATEDLMVPDDFKCSISLEMMRDPMVVAIGQTYDRDSIACAETTIFPLMDPTTPWNKMTVSTDNASTHTKTNKATLEADEFATASLTDDVHWIVDELQLLVNVATVLLNLSILEANKWRIMHTNDVINDIVHVLVDGVSW